MGKLLGRLMVFLTMASALGCGDNDPTARARETMAHFNSFPFSFELPDMSGKTVSLAGYKGKVVLVDLWGTWCFPCRDEIPHLVGLYERYHSEGLEIIGINYENVAGDEARELIQQFRSAHRVRYPCVIGDSATRQKIPGFKGYPTTLFIDRSGRVRLMLTGYSPPRELEAIVTVLLRENV